MSRWLVTGAPGMLGEDLVASLHLAPGENDVKAVEDAPLAPRSAYGRTNGAGEWAVHPLCPRPWVVRTAWLYGAHGIREWRRALKLAVADVAGVPE